jgi:hypothetical protein
VCREVKIVPKILNAFSSNPRFIVYERTEDIRDFSQEIENKHAQINAIGMPSDALLEKDIISHEQRDKNRCYVELYVINHVCFPQGPRYTLIA